MPPDSSFREPSFRQASSAGFEDVELGAGATSSSAPTSAVPNKEPVQLRFRDVRYKVRVSKAQSVLTGTTPGEKTILRGVDGAVQSGQILAMIGSSGAGKTSLLNLLTGSIRAGDKGTEIEGAITVNGQPMSRSFFVDHCAYVPQEDRLWSALTVRENLSFACELRSPNMPVEERNDRVSNVLHNLGLEDCQHTKVGNVFLKGISGGQKRRTSIGVELVSDRRVLFLDEPTSGLDAASAAEIMALLKRLAMNTGMLIVTSIHQPSTQVFNSFDQVILLTMGQAAFFGPAAAAMPHFASMGLVPKGLTNPADYLLQITNSDFSDKEKVQQLADAWKKTAAYTGLLAQMDTPGEGALPPHPKAGMRTVLIQLWALCQRITINSRRDPAAYAFRVLLYCFMSLFLGSTYYNVDNNQDDILNRVFLVLWMNAFNSYMDMAALPVFSLEKEAVVKEFRNGHYNVVIYCLANALVQIPFVMVTALAATVPAYWITGMNNDVERFFQFLVLMWGMLYAVESLAVLLGAVVKNFILALAVFSSILSMFFIFNGFFISVDNMPPFWIWIYWISPLRYSFESMIQVVIKGQTYSGMDTCQTCYGATGEEVLDSLTNGGTNLNDVPVWGWFGVMLAIAAVYRLLHYLVLRSSVR